MIDKKQTEHVLLEFLLNPLTRDTLEAFAMEWLQDGSELKKAAARQHVGAVLEELLESAVVSVRQQPEEKTG